MKIDLKARYQHMHEVVDALEQYQAMIDPGVAESRKRARQFESDNPEEDETEVVVDADDLAFEQPVLENLEFEEPLVEEFGFDDAEVDGIPRFSEEELVLPERQAEAVESNRAEAKASAPRTVLCVEPQTEIQDVLRKKLSKEGYRVLLMSDAERAVERFREAPPDLVFIDADGLGAEALTAFQQMHEQAEEVGQTLRVLILLGPRQKPLPEKLPKNVDLIVLVKPVKMKEVLEGARSARPGRMKPRDVLANGRRFIRLPAARPAARACAPIFGAYANGQTRRASAQTGSR